MEKKLTEALTALRTIKMMLQNQCDNKFIVMFIDTCIAEIEIEMD